MLNVCTSVAAAAAVSLDNLKFHEAFSHFLFYFFFGRGWLSHPRRVFELADEGALGRLQPQTEFDQGFELGRQLLETGIESRLNLLPEGLRVVLDKHEVVLVFVGCLLEGGLPRDHIEQNHPQSKDVCFPRLVEHFKVDLGGHVVYRAHKSFAIFIQVTCEDEVRNFHVKLLLFVNKQVLWL